MTKGTSQRENIYVRGTCQRCQDEDVLVYEIDDQLLCAEDYRNATRKYRYVQHCDNCNAPSAVRDPNHRRNEYLCWNCHTQNGFVVNNTVIKRAIISLAQNFKRGAKTKCAAAGYGSPCDNNIKPRGPWGGKSLCDAHGKTPPKKEKKTKS